MLWRCHAPPALTPLPGWWPRVCAWPRYNSIKLAVRASTRAGRARDFKTLSGGRMQGAGLEKQGAGPVNGDTVRQGEETNAAGCLNLHANNDMHKQVTNDDNDAVSHSSSHSHSRPLSLGASVVEGLGVAYCWRPGHGHHVYAYGHRSARTHQQHGAYRTPRRTRTHRLVG